VPYPLSSSPPKRQRVRWLPAGVLVLGLALTGLLCAWSVHTSTREANAELDRQASAFAAALTSRIQSYVDTLPGLRVFGVLQKSPSDAEFLQYVQAISLQKRFPGLALTFMADLVPNAQRSEYVQSVAADRSTSAAGHPGFMIQPPGERPVYMVVRHTYPLDQPTFGFDLYDPGQHYRAVVEAAVAGGQYVATEPLLLARDRFAQSKPLLTSVVIRAAVYAHGVIPPTPEARAQAAQGVVGIAFRTNDLVRSVLPETLAHGNHVVITDTRAHGSGANDIVFDSAWADPTSKPEALRSKPWSARVQVADRKWDVEVRSLGPAWAIDQNTWWLLALGLALSAALAAMTRILVQANVVANSRIRIATSALAAEKGSLQALLDNISSGVIAYGADTHVIDANPAACRITGLSSDQLRGKVAIDPFWCFLEEDGSVMPLERYPVQRVLSSGSAVNKMIMGMRRPDLPEPTWGQVDAYPLRDEQGRIERVVVTFADITDLQKALAEQARMAAMVEGASDAIIGCDTAGQVLNWNLAAQALLGYAADEIVGRSIQTIYSSDRAADLPDILARLAQGESSEDTDTVRRHKNGALVNVWVRSTPIRGPDGKIVGSSAITRDISERKRVEDRMRRVNRSLRVLSSCSMGTTGFEDESAFLAQVCEAVVAAGGYRMAWVGCANDDPEKSVRVVALAGADDGYLDSAQISWDSERVTGRGPFGTAIRTGRTQVNQDWRTNPATTPWVKMALQQGFGSSIALPLTLGSTVTSVLSLYAAESDAFNPEEVPPLEELARNVAAGVEALRTRQQRDLAEGANRAKSEFLANMSHEIRTPLNAIIGLNYLIRRDGVTPQQADRLDKIENAGQHLLSILNDVLELAKIESGRVQLETTNFQLSAVLDAVKDIIEEPASAKGLAITVDSNAVPLWLRGDPTRLRQAFLNFASNAVKFTEKGSIALCATLVQDRGDDLLVRFSVTDTGIGLAAEQISRLFQPFEQADMSITRKFGGTGLGLSITKQLAELRHGECGVDSQEGVGSTFWFTAVLRRGQGTFPATAIESPTTAEELLLNRHRGARVLLAEDNKLNRELVIAMLDGLGLSVEEATNGQEAVAMASASRYDLVLMDMQMPRMGGLEATRAIRLLEGWHSLPIVALTGNAFDDDRMACEAAGMNDFMPKPLKPNVLYSTILKWLDWAAGKDPGPPRLSDAIEGAAGQPDWPAAD
jgi:PAS domain S-box-containing protein